MKVLFPAGIALIAMVACTPQQPGSRHRRKVL